MVGPQDQHLAGIQRTRVLECPAPQAGRIVPDNIVEKMYGLNGKLYPNHVAIWPSLSVAWLR